MGGCRESIAAVAGLSTAMEGEAGHVGRLHASLYSLFLQEKQPTCHQTSGGYVRPTFASCGAGPDHSQTTRRDTSSPAQSLHGQGCSVSLCLLVLCNITVRGCSVSVFYIVE